MRLAVDGVNNYNPARMNSRYPAGNSSVEVTVRHGSVIGYDLHFCNFADNSAGLGPSSLNPQRMLELARRLQDRAPNLVRFGDVLSAQDQRNERVMYRPVCNPFGTVISLTPRLRMQPA